MTKLSYLNSIDPREADVLHLHHIEKKRVEDIAFLFGVQDSDIEDILSRHQAAWEGSSDP